MHVGGLQPFSIRTPGQHVPQIRHDLHSVSLPVQPPLIAHRTDGYLAAPGHGAFKALQQQERQFHLLARHVAIGLPVGDQTPAARQVLQNARHLGLADHLTRVRGAKGDAEKSYPGVGVFSAF